MIGVAFAFALLLVNAASGFAGWWLTGLVVDTPQRWQQIVDLRRPQLPQQLVKHKSYFKCSLCCRRIRKHVWCSSWGSPLGHGYNLCDNCIQTQPDRDVWSHWMDMDIVRG